MATEKTPFYIAVKETFDLSTDFMTSADFLVEARKRLKAYDIEMATVAAVRDEYERQRRLRSIEKWNERQDALFPSELLEKVMAYETTNGERGTIKVRFSRFDHHQQFREKQISKVRQVNRSFERWEQRREKVMDWLKEHPKATFADALTALNLMPAKPDDDVADEEVAA